MTPSQVDRWPRDTPVLRRLTLVSLYGFGFFGPWSISLAQICQLLLFIVTIVVVVRNPRWALREPLLWVTGAFVVYVAVRGFVAVLERPDLAAAHWDGGNQWSKSGPLAILVVTVGFTVLGQWRRDVPRVFALWLLGVGVNTARYFSVPEIVASLTGGHRFTFGQMQIEAGVAFATGVLLLAAFAPAVILQRRRAALRYAGTAIALAVAALLLIALLITKTRTAWFAGAAALAVMAAIAGRAWWRRREGGLARPATVAGIALALIVILGAVFGERLVERMIPVLDEMAAVPRVIMGADIDTVEDGSLGKRIAMSVFAARAFAERPLFGYGPADVRYLLRERPVPPQIEGMHGQLHSGYSQIFNRFGIVGGLPLMALIGFVFVGAARLIRQHDATAVSLGVTAAGFTLFMLIVALAEQRLEDFNIVQAYAVVLGAALAPQVIGRFVVHAGRGPESPPV